MATPPAPPPFKVSEIALDALIATADLIVEGEVRATHWIDEAGHFVSKENRDGRAVHIGELAVERVLRGPSDLESLWLLAEGTWTCDVSYSETGERGLWFFDAEWRALEIYRGGSPATVPLTPEASRSVSRLTGFRPVHTICHSGRGKFLASEHEGEDWLVVRDDVEVHDQLPHLPEAHTGEYKRIYWTARRTDVVRHVQEVLKLRRQPIPLHPATPAPADLTLFESGQVVAALWFDGTLVWSENENGGEPFQVQTVARRSSYDLRRWLDRNRAPLRNLAAERRVPAPAFAPPGRTVVCRSWRVNGEFTDSIPAQAEWTEELAARVLEMVADARTQEEPSPPPLRIASLDFEPR